MIDNNIYFLANKGIFYYGEDTDETYFQVQCKDTAVSNERKIIPFSDMYYFPNSQEKSYLNIASFNINLNTPANIDTYLGAGLNVYSSEDNLYVSNTKYEHEIKFDYDSNYKVITDIYKFKFNNGKLEYDAFGTVPGRLLNQFYMDEKDGNFRIATTNDANNLYVLNEKLKIIGSLENLAKGVNIYSVRFIDNRAYIVTFLQVDPLFVIDLSNPQEPTVLGELKIPGYSTYLHPYSENLIIGFGEDTGMKMALFDVSDPENPKELYKQEIGGKGTHSEALYNHKALLFSKEKNIIAFPSQIENNYRTQFQGAVIYGLDLEKGFELKGQITHKETANGKPDNDYKNDIERIIYIKDTLFTLSKGMVKSTDMLTMQEQSSENFSN
jgi:uncharacterized secreted protein with C-terminal beta-propeller domain